MFEPTTIDCQYLAPQRAAAYLVVDGGEAAFVETNTAKALRLLLGALEARGLAPDAVRYIVVTHAHLDHAGGASALLERCPEATLLAHPRAVRHLGDPSRLVQSATAVYGEERFRAMYGEIAPADPARMRAVEDGDLLPFGAGQWHIFHARGHANHHLCVQDVSTGAVFTGDAFGLCYPALQREGRFFFPSTSPTDFDAEAARASVRRIARDGTRAYLTHFGGADGLEEAAAQLVEHLDQSEAILERAVESSEPDDHLDAFCRAELLRHYSAWFEAHRRPATARLFFEKMTLDLDLNAQGLAHVARRRRQ